MQNAPDYVGIAWKWLSKKLNSLLIDQWHPTLSDDSKGYIIVSGSLIDKTGESRQFSVLMTIDGVVILDRSFIRSKKLSTS